MASCFFLSVSFCFNDTATTEIYTLSLHDALPTSPVPCAGPRAWACTKGCATTSRWPWPTRSEEHTSELQSQSNLVCRLLLEKKKKNTSDQPAHRTKKHTHTRD